MDYDLIQKSGAWFSYGDTRIGQGREKAKDFLRENPDVAAEIEGKIRDLTVRKAVKADESPAEGAAADVSESQQKPDNQ